VDVERISRHFGVDAVKLASLVRYVDTMEGFLESPQLTEAVKEGGILLTARDQGEPVEEEGEEDKNEEADAS
jgi:hypothetical protein